MLNDSEIGHNLIREERRSEYVDKLRRIRNFLGSIAIFVLEVAFNTDKGKHILVSFNLWFALSESLPNSGTIGSVS